MIKEQRIEGVDGVSAFLSWASEGALGILLSRIVYESHRDNLRFLAISEVNLR